MTASANKQPNELIHETSPYLLQHAYNPVKWLPFGDEAFALARKLDKPVLISIGYSACHWCHVMERECFEDEEVAAVMNAGFVNIKIDREERSDVDMLYMQAVQLMTGQGGWPLNCFVMPDGRPFFGGTYFPKKKWLHILNTLSDLYQNDPVKVNDYATQLSNGIRETERIITMPQKTTVLSKRLLQQTVAKWKDRLDNKHGGPDHAPKFPLPSNYRFLLRYAKLEADEGLMKHVELTLKKMAFGGIYDQVRGGFSRYSVDDIWKVPHFEKMLYDNAQLVSLYTEAYNLTKNKLYRNIAEQTLGFVRDEWYQPEGYFYSAYDADSEGIEGKYYVWTKEELESALATEYDLFAAYFEINEKGYWEDDNYILMRREDAVGLLTEYGISQDELDRRIHSCLSVLKKVAESRIKPGLDDKTVCSWNAMMCSAYAQAALSFNNTTYKKTALDAIQFILKTMTRPDGGLFRTYKNGKARIHAFLEDYAFVTEALINCYLLTQDEFFLGKARYFCTRSLEEFNNPNSVFLFYTGKEQAALLTRTTETSDNVIPASNSQMAMNLFVLGQLFEDTAWVERAAKMTESVAREMEHYGAGYSNWAQLALMQENGAKEVAIVGKNVDEKLRELYQEGITNTILAVSAVPSNLPLLKDRYVEGKTLVYVCKNKTCGLPVENINEALKQLV